MNEEEHGRRDARQTELLAQIAADIRVVRNDLEHLVGQVESNGKKIQSLDTTIRGNGRPGHSARLKSLEDKDSSRKWHHAIFYSAILGAILNWLVKTFGGTHG